MYSENKILYSHDAPWPVSYDTLLKFLISYLELTSFYSSPFPNSEGVSEMKWLLNYRGPELHTLVLGLTKILMVKVLIKLNRFHRPQFTSDTEKDLWVCCTIFMPYFLGLNYRAEVWDESPCLSFTISSPTKIFVP